MPLKSLTKYKEQINRSIN